MGAYRIRVKGLVQGVGFRPFVWRLANEVGLHGRVRNDSAGVLIELWCNERQLDRFTERLQADCPPLAHIEAVTSTPFEAPVPADFSIVASEQGEVATGCVPDAASCPACLAELFDAGDRRYRYPFINCTHCGPRLSIIEAIPYDRVHTSMKAFKQCDRCQAEYDDPADRRFHAQPNACPQCGPQCWLEDGAGNRLAPSGELFHWLAGQLRAGKVLALKGLGGFHLACDATNDAAVRELRRRKQRPAKPFALMVRDLEVQGRYARRSPAADKVLAGSAAPIVLLDRQDNELTLSPNVAPGQYQLGLMLPNTPLHHLLLESFDSPLVMTSGNRSGQPPAISNDEARQQLAGIADILLLHDRAIVNRVDDSVVRQEVDSLRLLRRARGYAPQPLPLPAGFEQAPELLALGGELKSTLCLLQRGQAVLSQHLGDLEDARTYAEYEHTIGLYRQLYQHRPQWLVSDLHPEYLSSKYAANCQEVQGIGRLQVQHHHAHLAACLGEHGYPLAGAPVLALCLDGTGYGEDGSLWGGELLLAEYRDFRRLGSLAPVALPGGGQAIREPWRNLFAHLLRSLPELDERLLQQLWPGFAGKPLPTLRAMLDKGLNAPLSSSAGRLFDAVAAALACSFERISYEGQAAIELEALSRRCGDEVAAYPFGLEQGEGRWLLDPAPMWRVLFDDQKAGRAPAEIARAFHRGFSDALLALVDRLAAQHPFSTVVLTGGVFQNQQLLQGLETGLQGMGMQVLAHAKVPANDGGLAFGQALVAAAWLLGDAPPAREALALP
ncbi:carbamoyltransferase HypF [Marinobacterium arenosum]|uniref:carbamoyltransferase HypF n=1 Tax=Marinobacterium arenosum TaxID=2862496 RepID=UPI001C968752|nr:carbamoyltransferase HypF [Marinobacterium arenosum]MBY4676826.1 carbamoyltransferase HypF [Marinobacterium arenosum]